jgi:2-iminobutanoate/2-iminopropanoate deaminase
LYPTIIEETYRFSNSLRHPLSCPSIIEVDPLTRTVTHEREDPMTRIAFCLLPVLFFACQAPPAGDAPVTREAINPQLPERPYSQAMRVGNTYYFSGKLGVTEETLALTEGRIEAETRNIMESFKELFAELGVEFSDVVQGTVYLADVADYAGMNQAYGEYFPVNPPARECIGAGQILSDGLVEISFVAVVPN